MTVKKARFVQRRAIFVMRSDGVEINTEKLKNASENDKNMEYGVHPTDFYTDTIENSADGKGNAASQEKVKSNAAKGCLG